LVNREIAVALEERDSGVSGEHARIIKIFKHVVGATKQDTGTQGT